MKITKKQLRQIIKETHPDYQGLPQSDVDYYELADDYAMWVKENGHVTPAASSVMATYFLEKGLKDDHAKHEMLGKAFRVAHNDIMSDIRRQEAEKTSMMRESKMKITKRQLRQIIKEEQMTLNQSGVDAVLAAADQADKMYRTLQDTVGQSDVAFDPLFEELEEMLLDLPSYLRELAKKMKEQGVEGGLR